MREKFLLKLDQINPSLKFKNNLQDLIVKNATSVTYKHITSINKESEYLKYMIVIDKLEIRFEYDLTLEKLLLFFNDNEITYTKIRLKNGSYAVRATGVTFVYNVKSFGRITSIFVNPFKDFRILIDALDKIVFMCPLKVLESYWISRVDICLIIVDKSYETVRGSLFIDKKQVFESIRKRPNGTQSQYHGDYPSKVLIYDKLEKEPNFNNKHNVTGLTKSNIINHTIN